MKMAISFALAAVLLCVAAFLTADAASSRLLKAAADDLASACANVTAHHYGGPGLTVAFCESALQSDKRSAAAKHPQDLAVVAMDLLQSSATDADAKIGGALSPVGGSAKLSNDTVLTLRYCKLDYGILTRTVSVCRSMVQGYRPDVRGENDGQDLLPYTYLECADKLMNAAHDCWEHIFHDDEMKKTVCKEVNEVAGRANLAKAMVEQMLGIVDDDDYSHP